MVSVSRSETRLANNSPTKATPSPTAIPPPNRSMKVPAALKRGSWETVIEARTIVNIRMPVASLNAASVSSSVASFEGTLILRKISKTVAASVGEMTAANRKEM